MGRYCCENDIKPRKRGKLFLVEVKGFVNPQSRQVAELGVKPWISGSTVLLVNRPELVSISSHVRIPPHTTFYVNYLSDPWWSFWLNLFLNDPKQTYPRLHLFPTDLYLLMAPDPSSEGWDQKEGRPLPSQPVAYSASCLGNPSDPCRARVKMTQRQGIQRMLPKDCPEGLWEEEPPPPLPHCSFC